LEFVEREGLQPAAVVLTHGHVDHIAGVGEALQRYPGLPVWIHEAEREFPRDATLNLSMMMGMPVHAPDPTDVMRHGDRLGLGALEFEVRHVPGHSPGGVCLYSAKHATAIVGDTLFAGSIGRYDFPGSDGQALVRGIREQLLTLPDETRVLPGHGPETTVGRERAGNPYLR
jgi:glyoxylase-like metal-dependent hydrolase (beta-lactamase superfamily II)